MTSQNGKVLPSKFHWASFIFLSVLAAFATITHPYGFTLIPFPLLVYFFGRGKQIEEEGLKTG